MVAINSLVLAVATTICFASAAELADPMPRKVDNIMGTTPDATPDGSKGYIIEPDLVEGQPLTPGATVKKLKFGPYYVGAGQTINRVVIPFLTGLTVPCKNCWITAMQHGLEYANGTTANVDSGAWLHHIVVTVSGQADYLCPLSPTNFGGNRLFSGGNERVPVRFNSKGKYGMDIGEGSIGGQLEIMSEATAPMTVFLTVTFEYVPKTIAADYKPVVHLWLDVTGCGASFFPARTGNYTSKSAEWTMRHDGEFVFVTGHAHDGGTKVELLRNGKVVCSSKQIYGNRRGGFVESNDGRVIKSMIMPAGTHISDVGVCKDFGPVKKGDKLQVVAYYDDREHMQMKKWSGRLEGQMGIAQTYVALTG